MYSTQRMGWSHTVFTVGLEFTVERGGKPKLLTFSRRKSILKCNRVASLLNELDSEMYLSRNASNTVSSQWWNVTYYIHPSTVLKG